MTTKYILTIGLNDKDTKVQKISTIEAYKIIENTCQNVDIEGFTIYECKGFYTHENGEKVTENSLRVEIYYFGKDNKEQVKELVTILKVALNQESIAVEFQQVNSVLM